MPLIHCPHTGTQAVCAEHPCNDAAARSASTAVTRGLSEDDFDWRTYGLQSTASTWRAATTHCYRSSTSVEPIRFDHARAILHCTVYSGQCWASITGRPLGKQGPESLAGSSLWPARLVNGDDASDHAITKRRTSQSISPESRARSHLANSPPTSLLSLTKDQRTSRYGTCSDVVLLTR